MAALSTLLVGFALITAPTTQAPAGISVKRADTTVLRDVYAAEPRGRRPVPARRAHRTGELRDLDRRDPARRPQAVRQMSASRAGLRDPFARDPARRAHPRPAAPVRLAPGPAAPRRAATARATAPEESVALRDPFTGRRDA